MLCTKVVGSCASGWCIPADNFFRAAWQESVKKINQLAFPMTGKLDPLGFTPVVS
jgi:hypothetical protein